MLTIKKGNIFTSQCQVIVNTVNCVGVMGAGIALECRLRYPEMFYQYAELCDKQKISIGKLWIYDTGDKKILNFPTKKHWKYPSKEEYLHAGLQQFSDSYQQKRIDSIAFPMLGADKGGMPEQKSKEIMMSHLDRLPINIEIYQYDRKAKDDLYDKTKEWLLLQDIDSISTELKIKKYYLEKVLNAMDDEDIVQLNQLSRVNGIGIKTLEKIFEGSRKSNISNSYKQSSFDF